MIKHIVFDIGNVLMTFAPETYFIRWFQSEEKTHRVCSRIFTHEAWEKYDQGIWMLEDLYAVYHDAYPDMVEETDIVLQNWLQLMQPMQESIAFMKQMKNAGYGIYILSNISQDSADYLKETQQFFPLADGAVLSYEEKPTNRIPIFLKCCLSAMSSTPRSFFIWMIMWKILGRQRRWEYRESYLQMRAVSRRRRSC